MEEERVLLYINNNRTNINNNYNRIIGNTVSNSNI